MEKSIYDLLNDTKVDLNDYDHVEIKEAEIKTMKSNFKQSVKRKPSYKKAISIAAAVILTVGIFGTPLVSYAYENVNSIVCTIANYLGVEKSLDDYTTVVNQSITKQGITIQLNEVILDNEQLVVATTASSKEKIENGYVRMDSTIYINGKSLSSGAGGGSRAIDEHTVEEVLNHHLNKADLSGDLNVKILVPSVDVNGDTKRGPWVFEFKTNGDELAKNTRVIRLGNTFTLPNDQRVTLEKYTSNDLGQKIYYFKDRKGVAYDMVLRGKDDLGNKVGFFMSHEENGKGVFILSTIDGNLDENASRLTLAPCAVKFPEESGKMSNDFKPVGKEFTIDLTR